MATNVDVEGVSITLGLGEVAPGHARDVAGVVLTLDVGAGRQTSSDDLRKKASVDVAAAVANTSADVASSATTAEIG